MAGTSLSKGQRATLSHGGLVEIVAGEYAHSVHFDPPPPLKDSPKLEDPGETNPRKRKLQVSCLFDSMVQVKGLLSVFDPITYEIMANS